MRWSRGAAMLLGGGLLGVVAVVLVLLLGGGNGYDVNTPFDRFPAQSRQAQNAPRMETAPDSRTRLFGFLSFVIGDLQTFWAEDFQTAGRPFERTQLVVFSGEAQTGCGTGSAATGPFYCPLDRKIWVDPGFFRELAVRFQAPGDFAQAYVLAHEYGHHVQTLTGVTQQVDSVSRENPDVRNALSVRVELQADCLAGVWAHSTYERGLLERGDLEEGLNAAASVGDDRIQAETTGRISPETFTHGTAEQRASWFKNGFDQGDATACDTFSGDI